MTMISVGQSHWDLHSMLITKQIVVDDVGVGVDVVGNVGVGVEDVGVGLVAPDQSAILETPACWSSVLTK